MSVLKRDFGSFHVSNVQDLIEASEQHYKHPFLPVKIPSFIADNFTFGKDARDKYFLLEEDCVFLNHGAFGACLKHSIECLQAWQLYIEKQPLRFFDREMLPHMVYITRRMAKLVGCHQRNLVMIPNVTTGINAIMRSLSMKEGDVVYHLSLEYGAVKKILSQVCADKCATLHEETLPLPILHEKQIIELVKDTLPENCTLAVFDHIPSNTPFILPIKQLADICHERGVQILIDGAHALGQLQLNMDSLGVDYYLSNCHKWFSGPKGTALMYIAETHREKIHPLVISHGYKSGFNSQFIWTGLQDYSPFLALHSNINFWQSIGMETIINRNKQLADRVANLLVTEWRSHLLAPLSMTGSLLCIALPRGLYEHITDLSYGHAEKIQNYLYHHENIEVPIKCVQGHLYVRISVHIYNSIEEYEKLCQVMSHLTKSNNLL